MKAWLLALLILSMATVAWGDLAVTLDNDFFFGSDGNYTYGTEIAWYDLNRWGIYFTGLRNRVYTPKDIFIAENQPDDHPWCGVATAFYEQGCKRGRLYMKYGVETGVLGPASMAKEEQTWFHQVLGSKEPEGWDNQLQDEPVLNVYLDNRYRLGTLGVESDWSVMPDLLYGGILGTTDDNLYSGFGLRAGYNLPPLWPGESSPTGLTRPAKFFIYGLAEFRGIAVAHNAVLGRSLFHGVDEEHHVDLNPFMGEVKGGVSLGYEGFSLTYLMVVQTEEFEGQDGIPKWGEVRLMFGRPF